MIIQEIQLTNIGPYKWINTFDLRPESNKNVILIGGENGSGKTTFLNAIKLGLFGSYGYGFKTENAEYYRKVEAILNQTAKKNNDNNFRIKLEFSLVDNFEKVDYILYRFWKYNNNNSLKETFELIANGKHLSEYKKDLFQSKLKEIMPPQLLDLCLFDGEEISRIVNENLLSDYLKNLSKVVFNLDLFETLEADLDIYSNQTLDVKKMEESEKELYNLNLQEKELLTKYQTIYKKVDDLKEQKVSYSDEFHRLKNDFEKYGGLVKSERDEILKKINQIELLRKQNLEKIREFVTNLLPFYLTKKLLTQTKQQITNEESLHLYNQLETKLSNEKISEILQSIAGTIEESAAGLLKEKLLSLVQPKDEILKIHGASSSERNIIENMSQMVSSNGVEEILRIIEENKTKLTSLQALRDKLKQNDTTSEFSEMINKMEEAQKEKIILEEELKEKQSILADVNSEIETTKSLINKVQKNIKDGNKTKSSFLESQKIIALSRRFREIQLKKKLQQVQMEASTMLKRIFRKHNYVSSIIIEPETYEVKLYDSNRELIEKTTLSAGEKEILLISIIWSIFKCSGRKVPFIFDTLLGRLDKSHKGAVLREFIPNCGRQAIILSTDTEIDEYHYNLLKDNIAKEYTLHFSVERKETMVLLEYFPSKNMELSL